MLSMLVVMLAPSLTVAMPSASTIQEELSHGRLLFYDDGSPLIAVGMMQKQREVHAHGKNLTIDLVLPNKKTKTVRADRVDITWQNGEPASTEDVAVVETLEKSARADKKQRIAAWAEKGIAVRAVDVGGTYGMKGTVVDNRAVLLVADAATPLPADARPIPLTLMRTPATTTFVVKVGKATVTATAARIDAKNDVTVDNVEHNTGYAEHGRAGRTLRGSVAVVADAAGTLAVVNLTTEDAVIAGVLPSEMFASAPLEALKAQAVTARGELYSKVGRRHFTDPFHVCSEQHCQVYQGKTAETARTNEAAASTRGELLFLEDALVESVYSAVCGGHTEPADVVWDRPRSDALQGTWDDVANTNDRGTLSSDEAVRRFLEQPRATSWCGRSSFNQKGDAWRWHKRFTQADLQRLFPDVGTVTAVRVDERGPGGRLRSLSIVGNTTTRILRELPVRRAFGNLKSGLFVVDEERATDGTLVAIHLHGAGFGHGSGMCQQGAIGMAEAKKTYAEILSHFYNGAVVKRVF
jgi:stage II sporulation protein D